MESVADNAKEWLQRFGIHWLSKNSFQLGGYDFSIPTGFVDFLVGNDIKTGGHAFYLAKNADIIRRYLTYINEKRPRNIVELGIFRGGSTAFLQLAAKPDRLLAMELAPDPLGALDQFIEDQGLQEQMRIEYGVDQADVALIRLLTLEHLGEGRNIDVVFDDASHLLGPTRSSFETLFPRIGPGGSYIVEDYACAHILTSEWLDGTRSDARPAESVAADILRDALPADNKPLHLLAVEAMLASIVAPGLVRNVVVDKHWLKIVRGAKDFDEPNAFDLRKLASDHFGLLESSLSSQLAKFLNQTGKHRDKPQLAE